VQASFGHAESILDEKQAGGSGGKTTQSHGELVDVGSVSGLLSHRGLGGSSRTGISLGAG
jgi:hypothetical protein